MSPINVQEIERDLRTFLRRVEAGESFLVVSGEHPVAEVRSVPAPALQPLAQPGKQ
jgi:antitoxin (DNA-binding transcriptional repressor) of toxin-antitoxin stability system